MSLIPIPNTFTVGATIIASQHNANFSTIYSDYNGNITDANISASANISDTKLAQITTASKVSGAAITSLTSVPSGAGELPRVNVAAMFTDRGDPASVDKALANFTTDATWRDLDLSAIVSSGATAILIRVHIFNNTASNGIQFRKKGNTNTANASYVIVPSNSTAVIQDIIVPCSTAQVIQYNADNVTWTTLNLTVKGWWK